jgi:glycosyltransferase involved in cell wall biosynthesis
MTSLTLTTQPDISIGLPVFNGGRHLKSALSSLLSQDHHSYEIVISDNASNDETEEICRYFAANDSRIRYFRQPTNVGAPLNFEFVLQNASGKFFMWAAHDDLWSTSFLSEAFALLSSPEIDFVFPSYELRSINLPLRRKVSGSIFDFVSSSEARTRVLRYLSLHHSSHKCNIVYSLFRKDFIEKVYALQDITNDGLMGALILSFGRGVMTKNLSFSKRYSFVWPGFFDPISYLMRPVSSSKFQLAKNTALQETLERFPEYSRSIQYIYANYKEFCFSENFKIVGRQSDSEYFFPLDS